MLITLTRIKTDKKMETRKMKRNHPGAILKMELIDGQGLTISKVAELLNTTRTNISNILNGKTAISPNMALRIQEVFGGEASHFLRMQLNYDLERAEIAFRRNPPKIKKYAFV